MMPDSDTDSANLRQTWNAKSEGGGERILAVMDRSDQADTKQRKLHHLACAPLQPSHPYPSKLAADPMAQVEGIVCLDLYDDTDVQPLSSTQYHLSRTDGTGFQAAMCRNSAVISSTLLPGTVSNADLIISKRALRRCSVRLEYTDYIVKNRSDLFSVYLTEACF